MEHPTSPPPITTACACVFIICLSPELCDKAATTLHSKACDRKRRAFGQGATVAAVDAPVAWDVPGGVIAERSAA